MRVDGCNKSGCVVYRLADFEFVIAHSVPHHCERPPCKQTALTYNTIVNGQEFDPRLPVPPAGFSRLSMLLVISQLPVPVLSVAPQILPIVARGHNYL